MRMDALSPLESDGDDGYVDRTCYPDTRTYFDGSLDTRL